MGCFLPHGCSHRGSPKSLCGEGCYVPATVDVGSSYGSTIREVAIDPFRTKIAWQSLAYSADSEPQLSHWHACKQAWATCYFAGLQPRMATGFDFEQRVSSCFDKQMQIVSGKCSSSHPQTSSCVDGRRRRASAMRRR